MGSEPSQVNNFEDDWEIISNNLIVAELRKKNSSSIIVRYRVLPANEQNLEQQYSVYQFRKDSNELVSAVYYRKEDGQYCYTQRNILLYLEKIQISLSQTPRLVFLDVIHLFSQCLNGFYKLGQYFGCFAVEQNFVGVNNQNIIKTWCNSDYSSFECIGGKIDQYQMVRLVINLAEGHVDYGSMPPQNPSIKNFMYANLDRLTFTQAIQKLKDYVNIYNVGRIPTRLSSNFMSVATPSQNFEPKYLTSYKSQPTFQTIHRIQQQTVPKTQSFNPIQQTQLIPAKTASNMQRQDTINFQNTIFKESKVSSVQPNYMMQSKFTLKSPNQQLFSPPVSPTNVPKGQRIFFSTSPITTASKQNSVDNLGQTFINKVMLDRQNQVRLGDSRHPQKTPLGYFNVPEHQLRSIKKTTSFETLEMDQKPNLIRINQNTISMQSNQPPKPNITLKSPTVTLAPIPQDNHEFLLSPSTGQKQFTSSFQKLQQKMSSSFSKGIENYQSNKNYGSISGVDTSKYGSSNFKYETIRQDDGKSSEQFLKQLRQITSKTTSYNYSNQITSKPTKSYEYSNQITKQTNSYEYSNNNFLSKPTYELSYGDNIASVQSISLLKTPTVDKSSVELNDWKYTGSLDLYSNHNSRVQSELSRSPIQDFKKNNNIEVRKDWNYYAPSQEMKTYDKDNNYDEDGYKINYDPELIADLQKIKN